jgi:hypothetical protein
LKKSHSIAFGNLFEISNIYGKKDCLYFVINSKYSGLLFEIKEKRNPMINELSIGFYV